MSRHVPRPLAWGLAAIGLIGVLAVAIPYVYVNVVRGDAPAALTAAPGPGLTAAAVAGSVEGVWTVGAGSQAGYRVDEVLSGQSTTAVGRTDKVTGSLTVSDTRATAGSFTVDLSSVTSDQSRRDTQFRGRIMETARFPTATFTLTQPVDLGSLAAQTGTATVDVTGTLLLHGVTRSVTAPLTVVRTAGEVRVSGQVPVVFADYGIDNPSIGGFVTTEDDGVIEILLVLTKDA